MDKLGIYLKHLREQKNLSQEYVAVQIGMSPSAISRMETSPEKFNVKKLGKYLAFFNKSFDDYFQFKNPTENKYGSALKTIVQIEINHNDLNEGTIDRIINHLQSK